MSKHIAVLVSGGGTNLQALIDAQARGELINGEITAVISSNPGAYALERAAKAGIPGYVVARKEFPSSQAMTAALVEQLRALDIDLVVLAGFMVILSGATVHFVSEECDGGPIVLQKAVEVLPDDTPEVLQRRIMEQCEWKLLPQAVSLFCQGRLKVEGRLVRVLDRPE